MRILGSGLYRWPHLLAGAFASAALLLSGTAAAAEEIRIGGASIALGAMHLLADDFGRRNPDTKVAVLPNSGTSRSLDIWLSSRPLTDAERRLGAVSVEYARTPAVFAVSTKSRVRALSLEQITAIYDGSIVSWPDGSRVLPVLLRARDDELRLPRMLVATTDQEAADATERIPGALFVTTASQIRSENRQLRALAIDGVRPTPANAASGKYPYAKHLYLFSRADPPAAVRSFIGFVQSPAGQEILVRSGNWIP